MTPDEIVAEAERMMNEMREEEQRIEKAKQEVAEWMILGGPLPAPVSIDVG